MQTSSDADNIERHHQAHLRDRGCRFLVGEGPHGREPRQPPDRARSARRDAEARPVPERRSGHDEPVPARRGLRDRRRRRDRPRHRPLRALPRHRPEPGGERHDRPDLLAGHRARAPRRVPRRHRPGDPAHHRRDQAPHAAAGHRGPAPDVIITEIGGTVGDIESQPFIESARQIRHELGRENVFFVHVSLVPFMGASGEQKTKPTQHSVATLRSIGIQPDALVLRSDRPVTEANKRKIALMCDVDEEAVVNAVDVPSIYDIPTDAATSRASTSTSSRTLGLTQAAEVDWSRWQRVLQAVHNPKHEVTIGLVGKYIDLPDAYLSVTEALQGRRFRAGDQGQDPLDPVRRVRDARGCRAGARRPRRHLRARRLRHPRHRGQARRAASSRASKASRPSGCASACSAW